MPIALIPPGEDIPVKRGRGRPPGAKNREKPSSAPEVPDVEPVAVEPESVAVAAPAEPAPAPEQTESESETESEEAPPPRRRPAKPKAKPKPKPRAKAVLRDDTPPETPRTAERRHRTAHRDAQTAALNHRRDQFAVILDRFMR